MSETASWFSTVNNYHPDRAISSDNSFIFENFKQIIRNFAHLIITGKFVRTSYPLDYPIGYNLPKSAVKPIQSSVAISTASLNDIANILKEQHAPPFFTANTTQEQTESLFGLLRAERFGNLFTLQVLQLIRSRILCLRNLTNNNFRFFKKSDSKLLLDYFANEAK